MTRQLVGTACIRTSPSPPPAKKIVAVPCDLRGDQLRLNLLNKLGISEPAQSGLSSVDGRRKPSRGSLLGRVHIFHEPLKDRSGYQDTDFKSEAARPNSLFTALAAVFASNGHVKGPEEKVKQLTILPSPPISSLGLAREHQPPLDVCSDTSTSSTRSLHDNDVLTSAKVTFDETVTVIPIPQREEYSDRIRKHLWDSPEELQAMITKNSIEFAADGYDAQSVLEEDDHIVNPETGELVHPIHFEIAKVLLRERGLPLPEEGNVKELLKVL